MNDEAIRKAQQIASLTSLQFNDQMTENNYRKVAYDIALNAALEGYRAAMERLEQDGWMCFVNGERASIHFDRPKFCNASYKVLPLYRIKDES